MNILLKVEIGKNIGIGHLKRMESIYDSIINLSAKSFIACNEIKYLNKNYPRNIINSDSYSSYIDEIIKNDFIDHVVIDLSHSEHISNPSKVLNYCNFLKEKKISYSIIDGLGNDRISKIIKFKKCKNYFLPYIGSQDIDLDNQEIEYIYTGSKYSPINLSIHKSQFFYINKDLPKNILITCGGSDPDGITESILNLFLKNVQLSKNLKLDVVIGPFFKKDLLSNIYSKYKDLNISFFENQTSLFSLYKKADLIITATGTTRYESLSLNIPFLFFSNGVSANYEPLITFNSVLKYSYIGDFKFNTINEELFFQTITSKGQFKSIKENCKNIIDLLGSKRIAKALLK